MGAISPQSYESAAKNCYDLSEKFQTVYNSLQSVLLETSAMAGGYQAVKSWSKAYDDRSAAVTLVATNFARALQHFGDVLTAAGYNWKCAEYKANHNPNKGDPPSLPSGFPSELPYGSGIVTGVASSGTQSHGLETDWAELQNKVTALVSGGEVPDGDTEKLASAATAWKTFAESDPVYGGTGRLLAVAAGLQRGYGANPPADIPNHVDHLHTLAQSLREIEAAARDIATAVDTHKTALTTMRSDMNTQFAMVVVVTSIQIGRSMVRVKAPPTKQKKPSEKPIPSDSREENDFLDQAAGALAGPANTFLTALEGFIFTVAVLTTGGLPAIAGLPVLLTEIDPNKKDGTDQGRPAFNGADEAQKVRDRLGASGEAIGKKRNVAVARGEIDGQEVSLDAVSGTNSPTSTVPTPENPVLEPQSEDGSVARPTDSEFKILDNLAQQLRPGAKGTINLYTERPPCDSCLNVIEQFKHKYPGVEVVVTYGE
ncbi:deaminase domain-containing protein [Nocardia africana]|uniref:Uncharacterized protein n=1 Tax=Nocardia africana TaxID=134964 RepID=A0A378WK58_9NOCA|nr:deaminase domain-containing protein [Nocardia africana]MCC3318095.1 hypothetical protein [Nocardia africana]SUA40821.1 Uncharacterised protein [Nocardia africana]